MSSDEELHCQKEHTATTPQGLRKEFFLQFNNRDSIVSGSDYSPNYDQIFHNENQKQLNNQSEDNLESVSNFEQKKLLSIQHLQMQNEISKKYEAKTSTNAMSGQKKEIKTFSEQIEARNEGLLSERRKPKKLENELNLSKESVKQMMAKRKRQQIIQEIKLVNINNELHQEIVIQILQDKNKTIKDIDFLKRAISNLPLFQKNPDLLNKNNITQILMNEFSYQKFKKHDDSIENQTKKYIDIQEEEQEDETQFLKRIYDDMNLIKTFIAGEAFGEIALMTKQRSVHSLIQDPTLLSQFLIQGILENSKKKALKLKGDLKLENLQQLNKQLKRTGTMVCKEDTHIMALSKNGFDKILGQYHEQIKTERLGFLKSYSFFNPIPNSKLLSMLLDTKIEILPKKTQLFTQGEEVKDIFFLKAGEIQISKIIYENEDNTEQSLNESNLLTPKKQINTKEEFFNKYHNRSRQKTYKMQQRQIYISKQGNNSHIGCEDLAEHILNNLQNNNLQKYSFFHSYTAEVISQDAEVYKLNKHIFINNLYLFKSIENFADQLQEKVQYFEKRLDTVVKAQDKTVMNMKSLIHKIDCKKNQEDFMSIEQKVDSPKSSTMNRSFQNSSLYETFSNQNSYQPSLPLQQDFLLEDQTYSPSFSRFIDEKYRSYKGFNMENDLNSINLKTQTFQGFEKNELQQLQILEKGKTLSLQKRPNSQFSQKGIQSSVENSPSLLPQQYPSLRQPSPQGKTSQPKDGLSNELLYKSAQNLLNPLPLIKLQSSQLKDKGLKQIFFSPKYEKNRYASPQLFEEQKINSKQYPSQLLPEMDFRERSNSKKQNINESLLSNSISLTEFMQPKNNSCHQKSNNYSTLASIKQRLSESKNIENNITCPNSLTIDLTSKSNRSSQLGFREVINRSKSSLNLKSKLPQLQNIINIKELQNEQGSQQELNTSPTVQTDRTSKNYPTDRSSKTCQYSYCSSNREREYQYIDEMQTDEKIIQDLKIQRLQNSAFNLYNQFEENQSQTLRKYDNIPFEIQQIIDSDNSFFRQQRVSQLIKNQSRQKFKQNFQQELKLKKRLLKKSLHVQENELRNLKSIFPTKEVENIKDLNVDLFGKPSKYHSVILMQQLMQMEQRNPSFVHKNNTDIISPSNKTSEQNNNEKEREKQYQQYKQSAQIPIQSNRLQTNLLKYFQEKQSNQRDLNSEQPSQIQEIKYQSPIGVKPILLKQNTEREKKNIRDLQGQKLSREVSPSFLPIHISVSVPALGKIQNDNLNMNQVLNKLIQLKEEQQQEITNIHTFKSKQNINQSYHNGLAKMIPYNNQSNQNLIRQKTNNNKLENQKSANNNQTPKVNQSILK